MGCLDVRRSQWCLQGSIAPHLVVGPEAPNDHLASSRASVKPMSWQARASHEPANRRPAPSDGSAPLQASASAVTGELAASCSRQLVSPKKG